MHITLSPDALRILKEEVRDLIILSPSLFSQRHKHSSPDQIKWLLDSLCEVIYAKILYGEISAEEVLRSMILLTQGKLKAPVP